MKKHILIAIAALVASSGAAFGATPQPAQPAQCSQMTPEEQTFANQLTDPNNQTIFCSQLTSDQRQMAMQLTGRVDAKGNKITADQAVQQVVLTSKGGSSTTPNRKPGGACPLQD